MATNQASMARRQRERQRQQRRREKMAKRMEKRAQKAAAGAPEVEETIDWDSAVREEKILSDEDEDEEGAQEAR